jgi:hypothetical protein
VSRVQQDVAAAGAAAAQYGEAPMIMAANSMANITMPIVSANPITTALPPASTTCSSIGDG